MNNLGISLLMPYISIINNYPSFMTRKLMKRVGTTACMLAASLFSANAQNTTSSITGVSSDS